MEHTDEHRSRTRYQYDPDRLNLGRSSRHWACRKSRHPKGNVTGFAILTGEIEAKQVQILKDLIPNLSSIAVLSNPSNPINQPVVDAIRRGGSRAGIVTHVLLARDADEMTKALQEGGKQNVAAIVILRDDLFDLNRKQLAELALQMKVPTMAGRREYAQDGCFISYGVNFTGP
jgi:putative ABC transport system substrate-binding protein